MADGIAYAVQRSQTSLESLKSLERLETLKSLESLESLAQSPARLGTYLGLTVVFVLNEFDDVGVAWDD